jgi:hypothetical protein
MELVVEYDPNGRNVVVLYKLALIWAWARTPYCEVGSNVSGFATGPDRDVFARSRLLPGALNGMVRWLQDWRFSLPQDIDSPSDFELVWCCRSTSRWPPLASVDPIRASKLSVDWVRIQKRVFECDRT